MEFFKQDFAEHSFQRESSTSERKMESFLCDSLPQGFWANKVENLWNCMPPTHHSSPIQHNFSALAVHNIVNNLHQQQQQQGSPSKTGSSFVEKDTTQSSGSPPSCAGVLKFTVSSMTTNDGTSNSTSSDLDVQGKAADSAGESEFCKNSSELELERFGLYSCHVCNFTGECVCSAATYVFVAQMRKPIIVSEKELLFTKLKEACVT
ncbi:hypothetical protein Ciccas_006490 [Cichlidogyrus casuarinus]|uniref:Uncharacterized protein n=1 Tax=Cichlidogyrus casuarinus TaxID=1844966 RepID=A0ABD2Q5K8_9PLAT